MVKVREDLTGTIFGKLTVVQQAEDYIAPKSRKHKARWWCLCGCGNPTPIAVFECNLKSGATQSCGCIRTNRLLEFNKTKKKTCEYSELLKDEHGEYYIGMTTNTNKEFYFDAEDYDKIKDYAWREHRCENDYYCVETQTSDHKSIRIHQLIFGKNCDHIDRNPFNNRKYNLRHATMLENARNKSIQRNNTSGVSGVSWNKSKHLWIAYIGVDKKRKNLGAFVNKDNAIKARLQAEKEYFGEFAPQCHLFEQYGII